MQVEISSKIEGLSLSDLGVLRRLIESRLGKFETQITRVEAHIGDINGPKGGVDKACTIEGRLKGRKPLAASAKAANVHQAVQIASERLSALMTSAVEKRGSRVRRIRAANSSIR